ncbi:hypothetical protein BGZ97_004949 [Linnemannia gamsii]|jgi:hypothetical protein|uniref:Uncharacterized protein n=1 Tax=Linnemannia gamsii TaxID=64522 RepID=A0A9P6QR47_9FUNG|nr:hypothetical protein BGZ97_004949 [Linnemannia gamsii]
MPMPSRNARYFGEPRLLAGFPSLLDTTTIISYDEPLAFPPLTVQDHRDAVQVQLDAAQALTRVMLITAGVVVVVAAIVAVIVAAA